MPKKLAARMLPQSSGDRGLADETPSAGYAAHLAGEEPPPPGPGAIMSVSRNLDAPWSDENGDEVERGKPDK